MSETETEAELKKRIAQENDLSLKSLLAYISANHEDYSSNDLEEIARITGDPLALFVDSVNRAKASTPAP